ncbi:STAS domain-containing protein [Desulfosediminicola flagellatus]|uniref:STAS domain-containing protein n=1 Tax=Desulfosediminicola flagellatus TaxID=2569541 RepID=UPI0010ACB69B|nr:STAS domain-containing protein [Desulfosediminicola flagellatus]
MKIEQQKHGDIQLLKFTGRLASSEAKTTKEELLNTLKTSSNIVIDCSELEYVDSTGLGTLVIGLKKALSQDGDLRLAAINAKVKMLLELTKADQVFKIYPTVNTAISSFEKTSTQ